MFTEKDYLYLSEHTYWLDQGHKDYDPSLKEGKVIKEKDFHYKIIKVEDNITNGMQYKAFAPVKNDVVDDTEIVIGYAGTNPDDGLDILTDTPNCYCWKYTARYIKGIQAS